MPKLAAVALAAFALCAAPMRAHASVSPSDARIAYVPIDDRPATELFPQQIARICGTKLDLPPQIALGHFGDPGDTAAIARWIRSLDARGLSALVVSTDMIAYGGLVASRTPATTLGEAIDRLRVLEDFHRAHPDVPIYAFGTVMRLAPTATPQSEPYLDALTNYAQNGYTPDASAEDRAALALSRSHIPDGVFWDYIGARARDLDVDESLLAMASDGDFAALALTQDDAGSSTGLQVPEEARLRALVDRLHLDRVVLLNPGTDEMGMVMVMRAIGDAAGWSPSVSIVYAQPSDASQQDRLEYVPVGDTIGNLASFLKMPVRDDGDFELDVVMPDCCALEDQIATERLRKRIDTRLEASEPTAIADLSFFSDDLATEKLEFLELYDDDVGRKPLAYASWNTTANTAGTALAEADATLIGRHYGTLDEGAAGTFLFERYVDDIEYRLSVRPELQSTLQTEGIDIYALGDSAGAAESTARSLLWPDAIEIFDHIFAPWGWTQREISIHLPWQRTFEVRIDADLTRYASPALPSSE